MTNAGKTFPPEPLDLDEVLALLDACSSTSSTGLRNRALIVVLWRAGLRVSEALALRPKDVNLETGEVRVLHGKGDKDRTVGIDDAAIAVVRLWIERRATLNPGRFAPLFCVISRRYGSTAKPLDSAYLRKLLPRLARIAGIDKRVHAHGLRHTMTRELIAEGEPMDLVREQLGHSSLATTDKYVRRVAPQRLVNTMKARDWRRGSTQGGRDED